MITRTASLRARFARLAARCADSRWTARRAGAAACLPAALASLLVGVIPAPGRAAARLDVQSQIQHASNTTGVFLTLMNGQSVSGIFAGFVGDWRDSADAAVRYVAWRENQPEGVPRLGDPMIVVRTSGDTLRGRFKGVGSTFLALDTGDPRYLLPVAYTTIRTTAPGSDAPIAEWSTLRTQLSSAPGLVGVTLRQGATDMLIVRETISSVRGGRDTSSDHTAVAGLVIVAAVVATALFCVSEMNSASNDLSNSCSSPQNALRGPDGRYGASSVSGGIAPWKVGETRRP